MFRNYFVFRLNAFVFIIYFILSKYIEQMNLSVVMMIRFCNTEKKNIYTNLL